MHLRWLEAGALGTNAIVGGGVPLAAGAGWAHKHAGTDRVAVTYFGDGAVNIGSVLETMNLTAAWKTPLCFFIENNRYAVSTTVEESTAEPRLSARGAAFNIPSWQVDGMDPLAVYLAMSEAVAHMRAGKGPTIVEVDVYRYFHQNGPFPGSAFGYRSKDEEAQWRRRDPLDKVAAEMIGRKLITQAEVDALRQRCKDVMKDVAGRLTEAADGGKRRVRADLWPSPDFRDVGLRSDGSELAGLRYQEASEHAGERVERKFVDAVADVLDRRMETDPGVVVLGEDVHRLKGGTNGATRGLKDKYPDRVLGTPISENAFAGLGGGAVWTAATVRSSSSCTPTSCGSRPTRSSTRSARPATCSAATSTCPSCCAPRSRWARAMARSTRWTRPASSPPRPAGASWPRPRPTTTSA